MCERQRPGLPPHCWCCSSCPISPCWPSRSLTSCRSPSPTRRRPRCASLPCTSVGRERDTHLLHTGKTSETKPERAAGEAAEEEGGGAHRSVWGSSLCSVPTLVPLTGCCCSSGSCCGSRWCCAPLFSSQGLSPSLESLQPRAQEHFNSNDDI